MPNIVEERRRMLDQLCLALDVYEEIELFERENGELPSWCAESFTRWREWRKEKGLE